MTTYTITVPKVGPYMNANDRPHFRDRAKQTKLWREAGRIATLAAKVPALTPPVHITATVHIADHLRREVSNLAPTMKAAIDGMVDAGILADDSDAHVIGPDSRRAYNGPPRITFELEEVA